MFRAIYHFLFGKRFEFDTPINIIEATIRLREHSETDESLSIFSRLSSQPHRISIEAKNEQTYHFRSQHNKTHLIVLGELHHQPNGTKVSGRARSDLYGRSFILIGLLIVILTGVNGWRFLEVQLFTILMIIALILRIVQNLRAQEKLINLVHDALKYDG